MPEILGRDWLDFIRGDNERERARMMLASALASGHSREREFDALDMTGEPRRVYWRCVARRAADGSTAGWLCSGVDVTDRALREANARVAQDRLTRVARLATVGELTAGVAHEINQPLTAITTYARACARYLDMPQPDFDELKEAVREIGAEGMRAGEIIRRLRRMARTDGGEERTLLDVNALIEELRSLLLADARMYDVHLVFRLGGNLPAVLANGTQLQQVVLNLVRNAFEALAEIPAGSRIVEITTTRTTDGALEISIADNGPGVADSVADKLFEQFTTTKETGTGLGLAISRTVVQAHRGRIGTRKAQPRGAVFLRATAGRGGISGMKKNPIVMVVDDDSGVRNAMRFLLKSVGLESALYASAQEFLAAYQPAQPGCLVLDIRMPGMSGLELQQQLNLRGAVIPVIFMTGHGDIPMAVEAMQHGAFDFLQKPFRDQDLLDRIQRAIVRDTEQRQTLGETARIKAHVESLTAREREVLDLMTQGKQNKVIAQDLGVSPRTIEIHRARVMEKMNAQSVAQLVRMMLDLQHATPR